MPKVTTNNVPRDILDGLQLTEKERKEFDYLDWPKIETGEDSASFFRYKGQAYDLGEFMRGGVTGWDGSKADSFFSGIVVRYVNDNEQLIVGRYVA